MPHHADVDPKRLGETVSDLRKERGFTQQSLAEASGLSISTIRGVEQGARSEPGAETLLQIGQALGVSVETLLTGVSSVSTAPPPAFAEFMDMPAGRGASPEERESLRVASMTAPPNRAMTTDYLGVVLAGMRGALGPEEIEKFADTAEEIRKKTSK